jgi:hypothetical protein
MNGSSSPSKADRSPIPAAANVISRFDLLGCESDKSVFSARVVSTVN